MLLPLLLRLEIRPVLRLVLTLSLGLRLLLPLLLLLPLPLPLLPPFQNLLLRNNLLRPLIHNQLRLLLHKLILLMVLHDLLVSQQADRMNRHTMVLSLAAGIFLPVTLIAGMLGMNVAGVPLSDHPNGFWIVSGLLTLICVIELAFFKWAKWI